MSRTPETPLWHACRHLTRPAATGRYAPLKDGGALISGGEDLDQKGLIEYTWDILYTTLFVQVRPPAPFVICATRCAIA